MPAALKIPRAYTYEEIKSGLTAAGFENVKLIQEDDPMMGLVEACRPL